MEQLAWHKKVLGYIYPITLSKRQNSLHQDLKLNYYQGQYQLESGGALYSDGYRYTPFRLAYRFLHQKKKLGNTKTFLLLGAGLGSALRRLHKVYRIYPKASLVEQDEEIIALSKKYLLSEQAETINFIHQDALSFLQYATDSFDLIGIDLFNDLKNSPLLASNDFWQALKNVYSQKTTLIVNTIFLKKEERSKFEDFLKKEFTFKRLNHRPNYIYILNSKN